MLVVAVENIGDLECILCVTCIIGRCYKSSRCEVGVVIVGGKARESLAYQVVIVILDSEPIALVKHGEVGILIRLKVRLIRLGWVDGRLG